MPSLAGAVTRLTLACVPGHATFTQTTFPVTVADTYVPVMTMGGTASAVTVATKTGTDTYVPTLAMPTPWVLGKPRPDDGRFTTLTLAGVPGRVNVFTDKASAVVDAKPVVDTYIAVLVMGDVTAAVLNLTDDYKPVLGMQAAPSQGRLVSDTYVPVVLMPLPNMVKSGLFPKFAADSYVPVLTMLAPKPRVDALVVDSYVPALTMTATMSGSAVRTPVDTYVPVLSMDYSLTTTSGSLQFDRADTYVLVLDMRALRKDAGEVDHISIYSRPYGRIRIVEE